MFEFKKNNNSKVLEQNCDNNDINSINLEFKKAETELVKIKKLLDDTKISTDIEINNLNRKINYYQNQLSKVEDTYYRKNFSFNVKEISSFDEMEFDLKLKDIEDSRTKILKNNEMFVYKDSVCVLPDIGFEKIIFRGISNEFETIKVFVDKEKFAVAIENFEKMVSFYSKIWDEKYFAITQKFFKTYEDELQICLDYVRAKIQNRKNLNEEIKKDKRIKEIRAIRNKFEKEWGKAISNIELYKHLIEKADNDEDKKYLTDRLNKHESHLKFLKQKQTYIEYQENKITSGYFYILSNVLSFGKDIFKICVTDSLFPFREINKLNNTHIPYEYEIKCMYLIDDIEGLKNEIKTNFKNKLVRSCEEYQNFYRCSNNEIEMFIEKLNKNKFIKVK